MNEKIVWKIMMELERRKKTPFVQKKKALKKKVKDARMKAMLALV